MNPEFQITDWERAETGWLLSSLGQYLDTMEASLQETAQLAHSTLQTVREEYSDEAEWDQRWREHLWAFEDDLPTKLRYSFLILLYSYFERRTMSFCNQLLKRGIVTGGEFKKGKNLSHLSSVQEFFRPCKALFNGTSPLWESLLDFELLRNCIVHCGGIIADDRKPSRIAAIIERTEGISRGDDGEIRIELAYCKGLIPKLALFFDTCFDTASAAPVVAPKKSNPKK